MGLVYLATFTIKINQVSVNIPYMDPMCEYCSLYCMYTTLAQNFWIACAIGSSNPQNTHCWYLEIRSKIPKEVIFGDYVVDLRYVLVFVWKCGAVEFTSHWDNVLLETPGSPTPRTELTRCKSYFGSRNLAWKWRLLYTHCTPTRLSFFLDIPRWWNWRTLQIHEVQFQFSWWWLSHLAEVHDFHIHLPGILFSKSGGFTSHVCAVALGGTFSGWWFQFVYVHPLLGGNDPIWLAHIFQMGWFNHQLVFFATRWPTKKVISSQWYLDWFCHPVIFRAWAEISATRMSRWKLGSMVRISGLFHPKEYPHL